ncbi:MAG: hypothetical protein PHG97_01580, partial [Candidatus Margulisbacteria bacterium]|nr:hypothetical protein [Candidatus Margulisiibacteriota bacterium]
MNKFHFITVVWGDAYTDLYQNIVLPNLLSAGNLPAFAGEEAVFKIYTTLRSADSIKLSPAFERLSKLMPVEFILMDGSKGGGNKYRLWSEYNRQAVAAAQKKGAGMIFLPSDQIYADGSFKRLLEIARTGKKAVMVAGLRVIKEELMPLLLKKFYSSRDHSITISSRQLMRLALNCFHPITQAVVYGRKRIGAWPSHVYFPVPGEGLLARCFHLHPLLVRAGEKASFSGTIDGDFLTAACPDFNDIQVIGSSDEILAVELDERAQPLNGGAMRPSALNLAAWAKYNADPYHREYFKTSIKFIADETAASWAAAEGLAAGLADKIFFWLRFEP